MMRDKLKNLKEVIVLLPVVLGLLAVLGVIFAYYWINYALMLLGSRSAKKRLEELGHAMTKEASGPPLF